jgi:SAM-dependent methyltransferase
MTVPTFYDQLSPFYHLIFPDWDASISRQAVALDGIIKEFWRGETKTILDLACGVGSQALGLASLGYAVTASDISNGAINRARQEAMARGLYIDFSVADMREAYAHHQTQFDLVIACDNSVPHLLSDDELLLAFRQFYLCTVAGGGCLITVRDYEKEERTGVQVKPYGVRVEADTRYLIFQVWQFQGLIYDLSMYFVEDRGAADCLTHVMRTKYYAVGTDKLMSLLTEAGFSRVQMLTERFYQPVIIGTKDAPTRITH